MSPQQKLVLVEVIFSVSEVLTPIKSITCSLTYS